MAEMSRKIIKMDSKETELEDVDWIHLAQDRPGLVPVNTVLNF
jgi:hypothetical protein